MKRIAKKMHNKTVEIRWKLIEINTYKANGLFCSLKHLLNVTFQCTPFSANFSYTNGERERESERSATYSQLNGNLIFPVSLLLFFLLDTLNLSSWYIHSEKHLVNYNFAVCSYYYTLFICKGKNFWTEFKIAFSVGLLLVVVYGKNAVHIPFRQSRPGAARCSLAQMYFLHVEKVIHNHFYRITCNSNEAVYFNGHKRTTSVEKQDRGTNTRKHACEAVAATDTQSKNMRL